MANNIMMIFFLLSMWMLKKNFFFGKKKKTILHQIVKKVSVHPSTKCPFNHLGLLNSYWEKSLFYHQIRCSMSHHLHHILVNYSLVLSTNPIGIDLLTDTIDGQNQTNMCRLMISNASHSIILVSQSRQLNWFYEHIIFGCKMFYV